MATSPQLPPEGPYPQLGEVARACGRVLPALRARRLLAGRDPPFNPLPLWGKNAALIGMSLNTSLRNEHARAYGVIAECITCVAAGELRVFIERRYPLVEAAQAHAHVEDRSVFGRVVMLPRG